MGSHPQGGYLLHLEVDVLIYQVVREYVAGLQELAVGDRPGEATSPEAFTAT